MKLSIADNTNPNSLASRMRRKRLAIFLEMIHACPKSRVSVIDVGGSEAFWRDAWSPGFERLEITLLNLKAPKLSGTIDFRSVAGDARNLREFGDGSFDFCLSNSVIEHVGGFEDQKRMASECARISNGYFIQTPNRSFPIEPHFHFPMWNLLPIPVRTELHMHFNLGWLPKNPDRASARADVEEIRLLGVHEMQTIFPDAEIKFERVGPLVKSLIAVKQWSTVSAR